MSVVATPRKSQAKVQVETSIRIYNTLSKAKEPLQTVVPGKVGMYLCGPTVYDKAHIGHMVGPVIFDCIKRYLSYSGFDVTWVVNITDVDDKLITKAQERGMSMDEVAAENIRDYEENLAALGVDQIDHFPRATDSMAGIIAFIEKLVEQDHAYEAGGDVFFDVSRDAEYGKLSNRSIDAVKGDGGQASARKRNAADFALWKSAKPGEPSWTSPWGEGRPGWHIECSAMSREILGEEFDIHGGGLDLVFPHHENEIAQSECAHQKPMARYWMHNGLLRSDPKAGKIGGRADRDASADDAVSGKMSRSKGAGGLAQLIEKQGGERIRFFLLRTHYRSTVLFSEEAVAEAGHGLDTFLRYFQRWQRITGESFYSLDAPQNRRGGEFDAEGDALLETAAQHRERFLVAMDDDFNTGGAIGELFELVRAINRYCDEHKLEDKPSEAHLKSLRSATRTLRELTSTLGLFLHEPTGAGGDDEGLVNQLMEILIDLRATARKNKDFATSDAVRDRLAEIGLQLEDRPGGTEWSRG